MPDDGIDFIVRILCNSRRKASTRSPANPFLPYDPDLFVQDISDTHVCLLNKFNVLSRHLLIVTRDFEDQREQLNSRDFAALTKIMRAVDGLGFYNAGVEAGASQPHKHLQFVPTPLAELGADIPIDSRLCRALDQAQPVFPFPHAVARLEHSSRRELTDVYRQLLEDSNLSVKGTTVDPYNLLVTNSWMMVIPRRREHSDGISINALAFAGTLLVSDEQQLEKVRKPGPLSVLSSVVAS